MPFSKVCTITCKYKQISQSSEHLLCDKQWEFCREHLLWHQMIQQRRNKSSPTFHSLVYNISQKAVSASLATNLSWGLLCKFARQNFQNKMTFQDEAYCVSLKRYMSPKVFLYCSHSNIHNIWENSITHNLLVKYLAKSVLHTPRYAARLYFRLNWRQSRVCTTLTQLYRVLLVMHSTQLYSLSKKPTPIDLIKVGNGFDFAHFWRVTQKLCIQLLGNNGKR